MTLPILGPMTPDGLRARVVVPVPLRGAGAWWRYYVVVQRARKQRILRFANMELLESVAPKQPTRWRHLPAALLAVSLVLLTVAMAGPTHDVRIPRNRAVVMLVIDVSQSMRATDVAPSRLAAAQEAAKQFADQLTPGINLGSDRLRRHGDGDGVSRPPTARPPRTAWTSFSWPTAPPPVRASSPRCRRSPPSAR